MPYAADISRANPACFLFLIIECMGMGHDMPGHPGRTKGEIASDAVNRIVDTLVQRCSSGMEVRDYFDIGILGFTSAHGSGHRLKITSAFRGTSQERPFLPISQVAEAAHIVERQVRENYGGEVVEVNRRIPVWLQVQAKDWDPMRGMLEFVQRPLAEWIELHPNSYPPTVVIICDGWATDGDPQKAADSVKSLRTNDGNALLFIVHLSSAQTRPTMFPAQERGLPSLGEATDDSKLMFRMASALPEGIRRQAADMNIPVEERSRGLILNADAVALAQFLDIGTRGPSNLR